MGLFSKKSYVCSMCGKQFEARLVNEGILCDDCWNKNYEAERAAKKAEKEKARLQAEQSRNLKLDVKGYTDYYFAVEKKQYSELQMHQIINHKNAILEKYKNPNSISRDDLQQAAKNRKSMSELECMSIVQKMLDSKLNFTAGLGLHSLENSNFIMPAGLEGVVIDTQDVFAGCVYKERYVPSPTKAEMIGMILLTNDPFMPVFKMLGLFPLGFLERSSVEGHNNHKSLLATLFPNLTYPPCELVELRNMIVNEPKVRGNLDKNIALKLLGKASDNWEFWGEGRIFNFTVSPRVNDILDQYGYISEPEIRRILQLDSLIAGEYWNDLIEKAVTMRVVKAFQTKYPMT